MTFKIPLEEVVDIRLSAKEELTSEQLATLKHNEKRLRAGVTLATCLSGIRGDGGHFGGAYESMREALLALAFMKDPTNGILPGWVDDAGHRVARDYVIAASPLDEESPLKPEDLNNHRAFNSGLTGHPEVTGRWGGRWIKEYSGGRLGNNAPFVSGIVDANPGKKIFLLSSDGALQEGLARDAICHWGQDEMPIVMLVDKNNTTITGDPKKYMSDFDVVDVLKGYHMTVWEVNRENGEAEPSIEAIYSAMRSALLGEGPQAVVIDRLMAPGVPIIEGKAKGHDTIARDPASAYLEMHGYPDAVAAIKDARAPARNQEFLGSSQDWSTMRKIVGATLGGIFDSMDPDELVARFKVYDNDLEGSVGNEQKPGILGPKDFAEIYIQCGIMEAATFARASGFGFSPDRQGIDATFAAFLDYIKPIIRMAELNRSNVFFHGSHIGSDWMGDGDGHYGDNVYHVDGSIVSRPGMFSPADGIQTKTLVKTVINDKGLTYVFTPRSDTPHILDEDGTRFFEGRPFVPGRDEVIRHGDDGYVVSFGSEVYRALDAIERLRGRGIDFGLINKPTMNIPDISSMDTHLNDTRILIVEDQNVNTGLGMRFGTWLGENDIPYKKLRRMGIHRQGIGGVFEQNAYQGLDSPSIQRKIEAMVA